MIFRKRSSWIIIAGIATIFLAYGFLNTKPKIDTTVIKEISYLEYPSEYNYRQTVNDCGPFNVAAVARIFTKEDVNSASFAEEISWRLPNNYTLPWGLEAQLKSNDIAVQKPNFKLLEDSEKLALIQENLSLNKPLIILGERDNYEHYITLLGFDSNIDEYYIYDSLREASLDQPNMTIDENGALPGNTTINSDELLNFWRGGGMYGFWEWYGLVAG